MIDVAGAAVPLPRPGLVERAKRAFFRSFFRLLVAFVALAEWACVAWVLAAVGVHPPLPVHVAGPLAIFALNRWVLLRRGAARRQPVRDAFARAYVAVAFTCMFCALFLAVAGVLWGIAALAATVVAPGVEAPLGRTWVRVTTLGMATIAGLFLYGYTRGRRAIELTRHVVPVAGLPPAFDGFRIVHLSDLHIGAYLGLAELADHVRRVNALAPDLVCITGDLVDRPETCALAFPTLGGLRARHGVVVTLGNHDVYAGADVVTDALRQHTPFNVLRDAATAVRVGDAVLPVLGVDDLGRDWARGVHEHPALPPLAATVPADVPFLVLSHRPDCFRQAAGLGAALVLSGHTHGGQLALPSWRGRARNLAEFITAFDRGFYRHEGATLYVNRGLGFTGQPIRLFTPREIAVLELRAA